MRMMYLLFALAAVMPLCSGTYIVSFPNALIPGIPLEVRVLVQGASRNVNVKAMLKYASNGTLVVENTTYVQNGISTALILKIPVNLSPSGYKIVTSGSEGLVFQNETSIHYTKSVFVFIQTDKSRYTAGQIVKYRAALILPNLLNFQGQATIFIKDGKGNKIEVIGPSQVQNGVVSGQLELSTQPVFGTWTVTIEAMGKSTSKNFEVNDYILPRFNVEVIIPPEINDTQANFTVTVKASFTFKAGVIGNCSILLYNEWMSWKQFELHSELNGTVVFVINRTQITSVLGINSNIIIRATVMDHATFLTMTTEKQVNVVSSIQSIVTIRKVDPYKNYFLLGYTYHTKLFVGRNGQPLGKYGSLTIKPTLTTAVLRTCFKTYPPYKWVDIQTTEKASFVVNFDKTGYADLRYTVNNNDSQELSFKVTFHDTSVQSFQSSTSFKLYPWRTTGMPILQIYADKEKTTVGGTVTISITSTQKISGNLTVEIYSRGMLLVTDTVEMNNSYLKMHTITTSGDMIPQAYILVYHLTTSGYLMEDYTIVDVKGNPLRNKNSATTRQNINMHITADPSSSVYVLVQDERNRIIGTSNDIFSNDVLKVLDGSSNSFSSVMRTTDSGMMSDASELKRNSLSVLLMNQGYPKVCQKQDTSGGDKPLVFWTSIIFDDTSELSLQEIFEGVKEFARTRFPETWIWDEYTIGSSGDLNITLPVPDSMTTWVTSVFAMNDLTGLGINDEKRKFSVQRNFFLTMDLPPSIVLGEEFLLQIIAFNYESTPKQVFLQITLSDDPNTPIPAVAQVPAQDGKSTYVRVEPKTLGSLSIDVIAKTNFFSTSYDDRIVKNVTVRPNGVYRTINEQILVDVSSDQRSYTKTIFLPNPKGVVSGTKLTRITITDQLMKNLKNLNSLFETANRRKLTRLSKTFEIAENKLCCAQFLRDNSFYRSGCVVVIAVILLILFSMGLAVKKRVYAPVDDVSNIYHKYSEFKTTNFTISAVPQIPQKPEVRHIAFLKVHKAASSTMQNLFFRFGLKRNLTFVFTRDPNYFSRSSSSHLQLVTPKFRNGYDILCNHAIFNHDIFSSVLPNDSVYLAIVREPLAVFISAVNYYSQRSQRIDYIARIPGNRLQKLIRKPELYDRGFFSYTKNVMARDFGFAETFEQSRVEAKLGELNKVFRLVLLVEHFEESLVLMKRLLNWKLKNILFLPNNVYGKGQTAADLTAEDIKVFKQRNKMDYLLYDFFAKVFWEKFKSESGDVEGEVEHFRKVLQLLNEFCRKSNGGVLIVPRSRWTEQFTVEVDDCKLMTKDELGFIKMLRQKQGNFMIPSVEGLGQLIGLPSGCGEQIMIEFAPAIYITKYLSTVGKLTKEIQEKANKSLKIGLQKELCYQHYDGSFSALKGDQSGSSWLTAFVLKCFGQATGSIYIDEKVMSRAMAWLLKYQKSNGAFSEPGRVIDSKMQAGTASGIKLTAFILISLLENRNLGVKVSGLDSAITKGRRYLEANLYSASDAYTLAITCYALASASSSSGSTCYTKLKNVAILDDDKTYWRASSLIAKRDVNDIPLTRAPAADIEATSYALLTYMKLNKHTEAFRIVKWLVSQRNPTGGWKSTQDTVVSLQALTEFSSTYDSSPGPNYGVQFYFMNFQAFFHHSYATTKSAIDVLHTKEIPDSIDNVMMQVLGEGLAVMDITTSYYVSGNETSAYIAVEVSVSSESVHSITINSCIIWTGPVDSGMLIMEVEVPTGFQADKDYLKDETLIKQYETRGRNLDLYFDGVSVNDNKKCVHVKMDRADAVVKSQACHVTVYDYYEPSRQAMTMYESGILKSSNICMVCPYCGFCTGAG